MGFASLTLAYGAITHFTGSTISIIIFKNNDMKQYYFISMVVAVVIVAVLAAMKPALKLDSTTFSVDIRCQNCVNRLEAGLPEVCPGIFNIEADVPTHKVTVTYERGTETVESLLEGFKALRFKASVDGEVEVSGASCGNCTHGRGEQCDHDATPDSAPASLPGRGGRPYCKIPPTPRPR